MSEENQEKYVISWDTEKSHRYLGSGLFALGVVVAKINGEIIAEKCFSSHVTIKEFDKSTWKFWSDHIPVLTRIRENSKTSPLDWSAVREFFNELKAKYKFTRKNCRWICDNPAYDIGESNLMRYLSLDPEEDDETDYGELPVDPEAAPGEQPEVRSGVLPFAEIFGGYIPTDDPTEVQRGLLPEESARVEAALVTPHDHYPVNDARRDVERWVAIQKVFKEREESRKRARSTSPTRPDEEGTVEY